MKNKHGSTHSQTRRTIPRDSQIPRQNIWTLSLSLFCDQKVWRIINQITKGHAHFRTDICCFDAVVIFIFILFQVFSSGPLFALPYCHQFLAPIKTILSWHHKITFFCRWTFPESFWDKTCVDNSGTLVYTGEQRCGIYQSTTTIRKHDMFSGPFQRSNVIIEFHPFLIQARLPYLEECQKSIEQ